MAKTGLTERQKKFAELYVQHGIAARAHEEAGFMPNASKATRHRRSFEMLNRPLVQEYIAELRRENARANAVTVEQLIKKLDIAYKMAAQDRKVAPMVSAVMGMARITGLDKQIVEHQMNAINLVINRPGGA